MAQQSVSSVLWNRIKRLLPRTQDSTLLLLKGHLLIEEQLVEILFAHSHNRVHLEKARLTFAQKLRVAAALANLSGPGFPLFSSLEKLNAIRNRMAHHVEVRDIDRRIDEYLRTWAEAEFVAPNTRRERIRNLRNVLIVQTALLAGIARGFELSVQHLDKGN
jgi:hypothetical protein